MRLAYVGSRRLRGDLPAALARTNALIADLRSRPDEALADSLQAAYIEQATIQLSTNAPQQARRTAEAILRHYRERNLPGHAQALAAQAVLAQAWLTLHLLELRPDPANWREAASSLREISQRLRRTHGPLNAQTLTAEVEYGYALLCLGQPEPARDGLAATLAKLRQRLHANHPVTLRATLLLGRSYAQRHDYERSRDLHQGAYTGLRATLGPHHPDTLHAQFGLGVALVMTGEHRRGAEMLTAVRRIAPSSVGRRNDLYAQSVAATVLLLLPGGVWRFVDRMTS